ncbi:MAG TPA: PAS domain S-box protein [Myxococcota bacterium]|nr:PAS domain S-box protein [Myxococcota bacterium]
MTDINGEPIPEAGMTTPRLLYFLFPVIAVGTVTALLAVVAALLGFYREQMLLAAAGIGAALAVPTLTVIYLEIAQRRAAQRALDNVQARVGGIVESAMDAIVTIDELQRIVQFNAAAERAFRWPRRAVIGQRLGVLLPERFRKAHLGHVERFGSTATTSRGMGNQSVLRGLRADGSEFPIEASISQHVEDGRKLFTVILRDVTERVKGEEMLARSESRLRGILESAMDAIITVDQRQHIVLFNKAAEAVFACSREEAVGAPLEWFIPERFRGDHHRLVEAFGAAGDTSRRMGSARVVMGLRRTGEEFPIEASISQVTEHGQRFYTVILRDVTERVRADEALRQSKEEIHGLALAASSAREQEKSRIARELHDELGQALTALKIDVAWLREHLPAPPQAERKLAAMQVLLDGTVAAARRISSDLRPLMLDDLGLTAAAEWVVSNFQSRTGIACELVVGEGDLDLPDPYATAVFRVLQESLTNVAKHAEATQVEVTLERGPREVTLTVTDNGLGFAAGEAPRPGSYGLVGLRERATLVGGAVTIESAPGNGTRIELVVPTGPLEAGA